MTEQVKAFAPCPAELPLEVSPETYTRWKGEQISQTHLDLHMCALTDTLTEPWPMTFTCVHWLTHVLNPNLWPSRVYWLTHLLNPDLHVCTDRRTEPWPLTLTFVNWLIHVLNPTLSYSVLKFIFIYVHACKSICVCENSYMWVCSLQRPEDAVRCLEL